MHPDKEYLGDGAYIEYDGWGFVLTTEDGIEVQNTVYLEPDLIERVTEFAKKRWQKKKEG